MTDELNDASERALRTTWSFRSAYEREAATRFEKLAQDFEIIGVPEELRSLAKHAAFDSAAHAERCDVIARRFGDDGKAAPAHYDNDADTAARSLQDRILYEAVAFAVVSETINSALLEAARANARDLELCEVLDAILAKEISHARVGWMHLAHARQHGSGDWIANELPSILKSSLVQLVERAPGSSDETLASYGELSRPARLGAFRSALENILFPGFERFGVDLTDARDWADRTFG